MPLYTIPVEKALGWTRVESAPLQTVSSLSLRARGITLIGWLIDFLDARTVMAAGMLMIAGGCVIAGQAHSYAAFAFAYFVGIGDAAAATLTPCAVIISNRFEPSGAASLLAWRWPGCRSAE